MPVEVQMGVLAQALLCQGGPVSLQQQDQLDRGGLVFAVLVLWGGCGGRGR